MAPLKVDEYGDFVLKLKIKGADGSSQIRRTRLPLIADAMGHVSYEELVDLVVTFTFPDAGSPENFDCTLTYFDEDEDTVTIASTTELADAIEQFVGKKVLRISTEVKRKTSPAQPTPPTPQPSSGSTDRGTSTNPEDFEANLQKVFESFVGILVTAVSSLEEGISTVPAKGAGAEPPKASAASGERKPAPSDDAKPAAKPKTPTQPAPKPATKDIVMPYIHRRHTCDACLMNPILGPRFHSVNLSDYDICERCFPKYSGKETEFILYPSNKRVVRSAGPPEPTPQETKPAVAPQPEPDTARAPSPPAQPKQEALPFIHGRHTCDSCLMTPIIGKRLHATNMKDHDLCERCHANYQGTEIQFESVELPRDSAFQKRWNRRRNRMENMKMRFSGRSGRGCGRPIPEPTPQTTPVPPQTEQESTTRVIPIQTNAPAAEPSDDFDGALKEAIRRSLEDVMPNEVTELFEPTDPIVLPSAPTEEEFLPAPTEEEVLPSAPTEEEVLPSALTEEEVLPSAPTEEVLNLSTCGATDLVTVEDSNANEAEVVESVVIDESESLADSMVEVDEQRLLESMVQSMEDTMSVDSEKMASNDIDMNPAALDRETSMSTPERKVKDIEQANSPGTATDESFAVDAIGNGDIAEAMGLTLDMVAGVISEMLADTDNSPPEIVGELVEAALVTELEVVVDEAVEAEVAEGQIEVDCAESIEADDTTGPGALIMDSAPEDPHEEVDDWQVVDDNANEVSDIANATQMLGSVLFNSDIRSSTAMEMGNSDAFSAASTVPSDVPSDVPSISTGTEVSYVCDAQRDRWASQLYMLTEMGFDDERKCVETLERLQAANIGCDEKGEISVTQVVEAMFSEQK